VPGLNVLRAFWPAWEDSMRVALSLLFVLVPMMAFAQVKRSNPPTLSKPTGYTHVVEVTGPNRTIYISGQIAYDKDGKLVGGADMKAQAEQVFRNLEAALNAAGAKFSDVVKMNSYITDMSKVQAVRDVRAKYFTDIAPASTFVEVKGLVRPELMLEIEVVAVVPVR
jgi:2-iminobutanoate/2-iminopropanoate deaminase